jgi:hypothetical protein
MIWKRYAAAVIGLLFSLPYCAQQDTLGLEKSFLLLDEAMSCYESSPGISFCKELLQEAYKSSGKHAYFLEKIVAFLFEKEDYLSAREYVMIKRVDTLPNSVQARHHHFKGLLEINSGFEYFNEAYESFTKAYFLELRAAYPTFKFLSQIQNALGYTRMIYGGPNQDGKEDYPHTNWITSDLLASLRHFEQALYFDDKNENASINRDTLFSKILKTGKSFNEIKGRVKPKTIETIKSELLISESSQNDTLDEININYLPNNMPVILSTLSEYDELLVAADISGSMEDIHPVKGVDRFRLMRELILYLFTHLKPSTDCGIVTVGRSCKKLPILFYPVVLNARRDIVDTIKTLRPRGWTPLSHSISKAKQLYTKSKNKKALFLVSDGVETCTSPMDLCLVASDLHALGVDIHIISFIVSGMEDYELAYQIYNCMAKYSKGKVFEYDDDVVADKTEDPDPVHEEKLLLPPIKLGDNLKGINHFVVDLSDYFVPQNMLEREVSVK